MLRFKFFLFAVMLVPTAFAPQSSYEKVIPKGTKTTRGIFTVHENEGRVYYEIPATEFGKDFLFVTTLSKSAAGAGFSGSPVNDRLVRWERRDRVVLLRSPSFELVAEGDDRVARAVDASNNDVILMSFPIEAQSPEGAPVIDVTRLFTTEVPEISARRTMAAMGFDPARTMIDRVAVFPTNIEVEATQTYLGPANGSSPPARSLPPLISGQLAQPSGSAVVHFSMLKLPDKLMPPRLYDDRVGFQRIAQTNFGSSTAPVRNLIIRWNLQKRDPGAAVSEPVKPIVFYIDPATPAKWVPYLKQGVEAWQPAFEMAGFSRAIIAKDPPDAKEDPNWSLEDARNTVIRWLPSTIATAMGLSVHDPRTGEVLKGQLQFSQGILRNLSERYLIQVGPLDPRANKLPLPDELVGGLIEQLIEHEVGHILGLAHNFRASSTYPVDKLRDADWLRKMGYIPSVMDYNPFNFVVQPEDKINPDLLMPHIGPYDVNAIAWGYKPILGATKPEDEVATLNEWLKPQESTPWLRYITLQSYGSDPEATPNSLGDSDPIVATTLGARNIRRVLDMLLTAVPSPDTYDELSVLYTMTLEQWKQELSQIAVQLAGIRSQQKHVGQEGVIYTPLSRQAQQAAVKYLNTELFNTPKWIVRPEILERTKPVGGLNLILGIQRAILDILLDPYRQARLQELEASQGDAAYRPVDFLADLRAGLFTELNDANPRIDSYRRNLQRAYLEMIGDRIADRALPPAFAGGDISELGMNWNNDGRALLKGDLRIIDKQISGRLVAVTDPMTRLHMQEMRDYIAHLLDPRFPLPATVLRITVPNN